MRPPPITVASFLCAMLADVAVAALAAAPVTTAHAAAGELVLVIENHVFVPAELRIAQGQRVKLNVENRDASPEEFDSYDLNREKVIAGASKAIIWIGPLKPGRYVFIGEFHPTTALGTVIVE